MPFLVLLVLFTAALPAAAQLPKDLRRSVDAFTGDTILEGKYGRLEGTAGCGRDDIAITLKRFNGAHGISDYLQYDWIMVAAPFSARPVYIGAYSAFLNFDGEIVELGKGPDVPRLHGEGGTREETGNFTLLPGMLERIATTPRVRIRIKGTERTCDGILEPNLMTRAAAIVARVPAKP